MGLSSVIVKRPFGVGILLRGNYLPFHVGLASDSHF
jgi:hypothetical protein